MKERMTVTEFFGLDERQVFSRDLSRSPDMRNFKVTENRTLQKRGGIAAAFTAPKEIDGFWCGYLNGTEYLLYPAGGTLYAVTRDSETPRAVGSVGEGKHTMFSFAGRVYMKNAAGYYRFDGTGVEEVEGYIPLVAIGCAPDGGGSNFEDVNMLTSKRRVRFSCDGEAKTFTLPEQELAGIVSITMNGVAYPLPYNADLTAGTVTLDTPPVQGFDNLEIIYDKGSDRREVILKADGVMLFGGDTDGHVFLWGNPDYPAYRFHSELADGQPSAEYFPENNYTIIGSSPITDIISQYDRQLIFTKERAYYSYCQLLTGVDGHLYASFPVYNLNGEKGSLLSGAGCIMNNEPVTLCADGLNYWQSTAVENEKNAVCFSAPVGKTLRRVLASGDLDHLRLYNHRAAGELYLICGEVALIYNYKLGVWYAYDNFEAEHLGEFGGNLYFTRGNRVLYLDPDAAYDEDGIIKAYWESPKTPLQSDGKRKRLSEMALELHTAGEPILDVIYGEDMEHGVVLNPKHEGEGLLDLHFRTGALRCSRLGIRFQEQDYAHNEVISMTLVYGRKGRYERNGI